MRFFNMSRVIQAVLENLNTGVDMVIVLVAVMLSVTGPTKIDGRKVCDKTSFQLAEQWHLGQPVAFSGVVQDVKPMSADFAIVQADLYTYDESCGVTVALVVKKSYARTVEIYDRIKMRSVFFLNIESNRQGQRVHYVLALTGSTRMLQNYKAHGPK